MNPTTPASPPTPFSGPASPRVSPPTLSLHVFLCAYLSLPISPSLPSVSLHLSPSLFPLLCVFLHLPVSLPRVSLPLCTSLSFFHSACPCVCLSPSLPSSWSPCLLLSADLYVCVSVCLSLSLHPTPIISLSPPVSPDVWRAGQDLICDRGLRLCTACLQAGLLPDMNKYVLPKGSQISTIPLCTSPGVNYCYMTNVPRDKNTLSKTEPIASARDPHVQIRENRD